MTEQKGLEEICELSFVNRINQKRCVVTEMLCPYDDKHKCSLYTHMPENVVEQYQGYKNIKAYPQSHGDIIKKIVNGGKQ